jgi:hypothetical protein
VIAFSFPTNEQPEQKKQKEEEEVVFSTEGQLAAKRRGTVIETHL